MMMVLRSTTAAAALCMVALLVAVAEPATAISQLNTLPRLNVDTSKITVSGVSSGAAFASQVHVAYSASISAIAMIAGPPYYCAQGEMGLALSACMEEPMLIRVNSLIDDTKFKASIHNIDDPSNMKNSKVWLYTGSKDTVVHSGVVEKTNEYYSAFVDSSNIKFHDKTIPSEHAWITTTYGDACGHFGSPFMNKCTLDAPTDFLTHFFGNISGPTTPSDMSYYSFNQSNYVAGGKTPKQISLDDTGYVYIPSQCATNETACGLHFAFHGCEMTLKTIGLKFVQNAHLNEYAESNNMIVVYPQAVESELMPENPKGCWDWWGYAGQDYASQKGVQTSAVARMINAIAGTSLPSP